MDEVVFECFGPEVGKVKTKEIESLVEHNLLVSFFHPFCRVGLVLIFRAQDENGHTFEKLCHLVNEMYLAIPKEDLQKHVERALDILLDIGLFSAKWGKKVNKWGRLFYNRNEVASRVAPYKDYLKASDLIESCQFLEVLLLGPNENPSFFYEILKINAYLAHISDIIDPDHWHINVACEPSISYTTLWKVLEQISRSRICDDNIKFYHERKKIAIYGLDRWIEKYIPKLKKEYGIEDLKITQCKLRFLLEPEKEPQKQNSHYDFPVKRFLIVPIVNFQFDDLEIEEGEEYPSIIDEISSKLVQRLICEFFNQFKLDCDFTFNAESKLLECKLKNFANFKNSFGNVLCRYGNWNPNFKMELKHLECWESFVPQTIRKRVEAMEKQFKQCLIRKLKECKLNGDSNVLVTLARKGNVLVKHLYEISSSDSDFVTTLKRCFKFNQRERADFHSISDAEFFIKIENGDFKNETIDRLIIFDDAIDKGKKLENVLKRIQNKKGEKKIDIKNIDVIVFVANKDNTTSLSKDLKEKFGANLKIWISI